MPVRPVLEIDVNADKFREFKSEYDDYVQSLSLSEKAWGGTNAAVEAQLEVLQRMASLLSEQNDLIRGTTSAQDESTTAATRQESAFRRLEGLAGKTAGHFKSIAGAVAHISRLSVITGAVGALAGFAGGLFGLDHLGRDASSMRRQSTGIGVSAGQLNAFSVNYAPYGDGSGLLHSISDANRDIGQQWALRANGIDPANGNVAEQALTLQGRVRDLYRSEGSDHTTLAQQMAANGLDHFFTMDEAQRLGSASDDEFRQMQSNTRRDEARLNITDPELRKWQDLNVQLDRAKTSIENALIDALAPLTPEVKDLSGALSEFVRGELTGPNVRRWVGDIKAGLDWAKQELNDPKLRDAISHIPDDVEAIVEGLDRIADIMGKHGYAAGVDAALGHPAPTQSGHGAAGSAAGDGYAYSGSDHMRKIWRNLGLTSPGVDAAGRIYGEQGFDPDSAGLKPSAMPTAATAAAMTSPLERQYGLPSGALLGMYGTESGFGKNLVNKASGAVGPFQFMAPTARQYGVTNPLDFGQESGAAARYMSDLLRKYGNDEDKALAAYNMGPGALDKVLSNGSGDWHSRVSAGVRDYVRSVESYQQSTPSAAETPSSDRHALLTRQTPAQLAFLARQSKPTVRIDNRSGASVIASARQASGPSWHA